MAWNSMRWDDVYMIRVWVVRALIWLSFDDTIQYNIIRYNTMQYNSLSFNSNSTFFHTNIQRLFPLSASLASPLSLSLAPRPIPFHSIPNSVRVWSSPIVATNGTILHSIYREHTQHHCATHHGWYWVRSSFSTLSLSLSSSTWSFRHYQHHLTIFNTHHFWKNHVRCW